MYISALEYAFMTTGYTFHLPGVLGILSVCLVYMVSEQQMDHYVQGTLETYILGAHIQVD